MTNVETSSFDSRNQLRDLLKKIHLMKSYATEQGMEVPLDVAKQIANLGVLAEPETLTENQKPTETETRMESDRGGDNLWRLSNLQVADATQAAYGVHAELAAMVKPATPESIEASQPRKGMDKITHPRVSDALIVLTLLALAIFIWGAILLSANPKEPSTTALQLSYIGSALLGASFSGLYTAFKYISNRTFDPSCTSSYITRVLLGAVSGLILANFGGNFIGGSQFKNLAPAALGLIGGYSADAVNLILKRIADTLVAAVSGNGDEANKAKQAQLQADAKINDAKTIAELGELASKTTDTDLKTSIQRMMEALKKGKDVTGTVSGSSPS